MSSQNDHSVLMTIICLCYNHEKYVAETLQSVFSQTYPHIELIVVDDCSQDNSVAKIKEIVKDHPEVECIFNTTNIGNCKSFNQALKLAKGKYIIDLAADDVLVPHQVEEQVRFFELQSEDVGVIFSNATYIDKEGNYINHHYEVDQEERAIQQPLDGDVYRKLIRRYYICSPTVVMRKSVIDELEGYDENLAYEDFDFWIRSSRNYNYQYLDKVLIKKRIIKDSLSTQFDNKSRAKEMHYSTYLICKNIAKLNRSVGESIALAERLLYEVKQTFTRRLYTLSLKYILLLISLPFR